MVLFTLSRVGLDDFPERRQSWIQPLGRASARAGIQIRTALRTEAPAVLEAKRLHWQRQIELLPQQLVHVNLIVASTIDTAANRKAMG